LLFAPHAGDLARVTSREEAAMSEQFEPTPPEAAEVAQAEPVVSPDQVRLVLRRVKDPELNLNVVDLGLIYDVRVLGERVEVDMSLTSPGCPSGPEIMVDVEQQIRSMPEVKDLQVNLVWSPYWTPDRIEPRVRAYLGF
jgi:metal-sulfur cluster biosynthetic enzyme